jgi:hypothetical protein
MTDLLSSKTQARVAHRHAGFSCFRVLQVLQRLQMLARTRTRKALPRLLRSMSAGHAQWIVTLRSLRCDRYSGSLRRFICGGLSWRACQKNYSINAGKIGTNNAQGCCFNLSRHKAIERVVDDLKLSRLGSYNQTERSVRLPLPRFDESL